MLQLQVLSGKQAGVVFNARRFPVSVGRNGGNQLRLEDDGVWDNHFNISLDSREGFTLTTHPGALLDVNSESVQNARLRNGDIITAGSARLVFRIGETTQRGLALSEAFAWLMVAAVTVLEISLVYWLVQ